jgi:hypothetical protein
MDKKIPKKIRKSKRHGEMLEDINLELMDTNKIIGDEVTMEMSHSTKSVQDSNKTEESTELIEDEEKCPQCGGFLVFKPISDNRMGVGKTYAQGMTPYSVCCEVVCSNCALVVKTITYNVHS